MSKSVGINDSIPAASDNPDEPDAADQEDSFLPSTSISLPILSRSSFVNGHPTDDVDSDTIKSEISATSANPDYNFSTKFQYNHIQQLCNDLLITNTSKCTVLLQSKEPPKKGKKDGNAEDSIFGVVTMDWKRWILSLIQDDGDCSTFTLPIVDPADDTMKKGEIEMEINFFSQSQVMNEVEDDKKDDIQWEQCTDFKVNLPSKHSLLTIHSHSVQSIPDEWHCGPEDTPQHSLAVSFEVVCGEDYAERIEIDRALQSDDDGKGGLLDEEWTFLVDDHALNHYLQTARNRHSFDIQVW